MSWPTVALGELCEINVGKTPSRANKSYWTNGTEPWLSIADMTKGFLVTETKERITKEAAKSCNCKLAATGTVLMSFKLSVGKVSLATFPLYTNEAIAALPIKNKSLLCEEYLVHALKSIDLYLATDRAAMGLTLNKDKLKRIQIPLPPLAEQKRIAAILDKADEIRRKREQTIAKLDQLAQSIFVEMFGDAATNPKKWTSVKLGDLIFSASDGPHVSPKYVENGIPFLSARHVRPSEIIWKDLKYLSVDDAEIHWKKCKPSFGDILYSKGGTTGYAAVVNTYEEFAIWVHIALLKPNLEKCNSVWLEHMLNNQYCYRQSQELTHGIANRDLGLKRMVHIAMYHPPLALQEQFANRIEKLERLKADNLAALAKQTQLFASLQHQAFTGQL